MKAAALEAAFRATTYRVDTPEGVFDLRIGVADPVFDSFLRGRGIACWAIVSAFNPGAMQQPAEENRRRQQLLRERVTALGYRFCAALNLPDADDWSPEPSLLVLEMGEAQGRALAGEFSQLAVVCGDTGAAPRLVWT